VIYGLIIPLFGVVANWWCWDGCLLNQARARLVRRASRVSQPWSSRVGRPILLQAGFQAVSSPRARICTRAKKAALKGGCRQDSRPTTNVFHAGSLDRPEACPTGADQQLALVDDLRGQMIVEFDKDSSWLTTSARHASRSKDCSSSKLSLGTGTGPLDILVIGHPSDGRLAPMARPRERSTIQFEDAHIFPESGPDELAVGVFAEPVHMEYARGFDRPRCT